MSLDLDQRKMPSGQQHLTSEGLGGVDQAGGQALPAFRESTSKGFVIRSK